MRFWIAGTCSAGISTPRSPRATITASVSATIASRRSIAAGFSSLATMPARPWTIACDLDDVLGALHERQREPVDARASGRSRDRAVLLRHRRERQHDVGHVDALALGKRAADDDAWSRRSPARSVSTRRRSRPSSSSSSVPGLSAAKISGCGSGARVASPGVSRSRSRRNGAPSTSLTGPSANVPMRSFGPCRSSSTPIGRPTSLSIERISVEPLLVVVVRAVAEVEPEHVGAGANQRFDGGAVGARGAEGGDDLGVAGGVVIGCLRWMRPSMTMARKSLTLVSVGPVTTESPSASKKPWPSLSSRRSRGVMPCAQARVSVSGRQQRAGDLFLAVDAVGVAGDRVHAGLAVQRDAERQQELDVAAAAALAAHRDRRLAAGEQHARRRERLAASATWRAMPAITLPTSRASPSMASPRM